MMSKECCVAFLPIRSTIFSVDQWKNNKNKINKNNLVNFKNMKTYFYLLLQAN